MSITFRVEFHSAIFLASSIMFVGSNGSRNANGSPRTKFLNIDLLSSLRFMVVTPTFTPNYIFKKNLIIRVSLSVFTLATVTPVQSTVGKSLFYTLLIIPLFYLKYVTVCNRFKSV